MRCFSQCAGRVCWGISTDKKLHKSYSTITSFVAFLGWTCTVLIRLGTSKCHCILFDWNTSNPLKLWEDLSFDSSGFLRNFWLIFLNSDFFGSYRHISKRSKGTRIQVDFFFLYVGKNNEIDKNIFRSSNEMKKPKMSSSRNLLSMYFWRWSRIFPRKGRLWRLCGEVNPTGSPFHLHILQYKTSTYKLLF